MRWCRLRKHLNPIQRAAAVAHEDVLGTSRSGPYTQEEESDEVSLGGAGPALPLLPDPFAPRAPPPAILGLPAAVTATPVLELELGHGSQGWGGQGQEGEGEAAAEAGHVSRLGAGTGQLTQEGAEQAGAGGLLLPGAARKKRRVGVLQSVPQVAPTNEHLASALKRASRVVASATIKNEAEKERHRAARQMDTLMKELSVPLSRYVNGFPDPDRLHPFDAALLQLTVNIAMYRSVLSKVDSLRKAVQEQGKQYAKRAANAPNKLAALEAALEGCQSLEGVFRAGARHVEDLRTVAKKLRGLPVLDVGLPTLALVGAPNVGKSSLVQLLSSGNPEVCNYPFTTRSIKMGHFFLDSRMHQVTDTPGLLARPDQERNKMELLTLAALACLPTSVLFVMDLTEECGTSVQEQWRIRREVRDRFPEKGWIDVFSKADMLQAVFREAAALRPSLLQSGQQAFTHHTPHATPEAREELHAQPVQQETVEQTPPHVLPHEPHPEVVPLGDALTVRSPAEMAARLPDALHVSSLTQAGIPTLQAAIIDMFTAQAATRAALAATAAAATLQSAPAVGAVAAKVLPRLPSLG
ncbi:hypothetical protein QJQ45_030036 [Haematococcus lacustris]|nr:hypothetical protein QJQ45_030036 [Haematococcus lacustris]